MAVVRIGIFGVMDPSIPPPLPGLYPFDPDLTSDSYLIYEGPFDVGNDPAQLRSTEGRIWLTVSDRLTIRWRAPAPLDLGGVTISLPARVHGSSAAKLSAECFSTEGGGLISDAQIGDPEASLSYVVTHWFNLPAVLPCDPLQAPGLVWAGRWRSNSQGWSLTLDARPDHSQAVAAAREPGHAVHTHTGKLERADGAVFSPSEAIEILSAWSAALSFATGRWVAPALPVGFNDTGDRIWEHFAPWRCSGYHGHFSWLNTHRSDDLFDFCDRFITEWLDPNRHAAIRHSAFHAVSASSDDTTLEAKVMIAQAGLEYLGWVTQVIEGSRDPKGQQHAHTTIRQLLTQAAIPTRIRPEFNELQQFLGVQTADGPAAITRLRNRLVHPKDADEPYRIQGALSQCWLTSREYLDLLVLARIGYTGEHVPYIPWLFAHQSQKVPWSS